MNLSMRMKKYLIFTGAIAIVSLMIVLLITPKAAAESNHLPGQFKVESVYIEEGDSLWSIANTYYTNDYESVADLIDEIKESNGLTTDTIHAGNYIIVPYYEERNER